MCLVAGCLLNALLLLLRSQDLEIELSKFESVIQSVQQSGLTTPKLSSSSELASGSPSKRHNRDIVLNDPETPNTKKVQFYLCFYEWLICPLRGHATGFHLHDAQFGRFARGWGTR
jgi:hypothetical protein